ncbi:uncharacterized protein LOC117327438 [Pecten maximus]|uniref:uncharacterized protein LOC117327438 n=1 Tax=Pecten maximus TaxID=6579 RepID=UPI00145805B8|nr:uncharacterized protein LOC117327438 [Pecten maximus]XP_033740298.1 uncharacterized protein LOC117327438 [Pecten maximus]XP_033740299.1 uncharacterized protein LOC117327438 [Pecten maximus]
MEQLRIGMESTLGAVFTPPETSGSDSCIIAQDSENVPMDEFCEMFRQRRGLPSIKASLHITEIRSHDSTQQTVLESTDWHNALQIHDSTNKDDNAIGSTVFRSIRKRMRLNNEKKIAKCYAETNGNRFGNKDGKTNHQIDKDFFRQSLQCVPQYNNMSEENKRFLRELNIMVPGHTLQVHMVHNQQSHSAAIYPTTPQHLRVDDNRSRKPNGGLSDNGEIEKKNDEDSTSYCARNPKSTDEEARTDTYLYWENGDPSVFINAGFFYTGDQDIVRCFHCDIGIAGWNPTDDPWVGHARYRPDCRFLRQEKSQEWIDNIQIEWAKTYTPKHQEYQRIDVRQRSFQHEDWHRNNTSQSPEHLATAGFFLDGDHIRCHYCDGIMRKDVYLDEDTAEDTDEFWIKHAHTFPFCKFVQNQKGLDFVKTCTLNNSDIANPDHYLPVAAGPEGHVFRLSCVQEFSIRAKRDPI